MATKRTYMTISGRVVHFSENKTFMTAGGVVVSEQAIAAPAGGRIMSSLTNGGGLAGNGGLAGKGGGLAG